MPGLLFVQSPKHLLSGPAVTLKNWRIRNQYSVEQAAEVLGIQPTILQKIEDRDIFPDLATAKKIALRTMIQKADGKKEFLIPINSWGIATRDSTLAIHIDKGQRVPARWTGQITEHLVEKMRWDKGYLQVHSFTEGRKASYRVQEIWIVDSETEETRKIQNTAGVPVDITIKEGGHKRYLTYGRFVQIVHREIQGKREFRIVMRDPKDKELEILDQFPVLVGNVREEIPHEG